MAVLAARCSHRNYEQLPTEAVSRTFATASEMKRDRARVLDVIRRGGFIDAVHAMVNHVDHDVVDHR